MQINKPDRNFPKAKSSYDLNKYVATFAIAALFLIMGIFIGNYLNNQKVLVVDEMQNNLKYELMSIELQDLLFKQDPCHTPITFLEDTLSETSDKISFLEDQLGKTNDQVIELKKYYSILEIKHYLLLKERKDKCKTNDTLILFFYSNEKAFIEESEKQGYVLDSLRQEYDSNKIKIYSLDVNIPLSIINYLIDFYKISYQPSLIINDNLLVGFKTKEEIKENILL